MTVSVTSLNFGRTNTTAMENVSVLFLLFLLSFFPEGVKSVIQTQQTVMAAVGEEAHLSCSLMQPKDVLQITWQVILPGEEKNLGTCNKYFGQRVTSDFRDKVDIKTAGLQNSTVVIRKVTEEDEGCYRCLFNAYPDGALSAKTCLKLCELHEPVLHFRESNSTKELLVSCSATGRPAPTVTLNVTQGDLYFSRFNTVSVTYSNATVSVTTTAVLSGFHDSNTQVGCRVRIPSGPQKEVFAVIPKFKQMFADDFNEEVGSDTNFTLIIVLIVTVNCVLFGSLMFLLHKQKHRSSDPEKIKTPQKPVMKTESVTPLIEKVNENIQKRTSVNKIKKKDQPERSPLTTKCVQKLFDHRLA